MESIFRTLLCLVTALCLLCGGAPLRAEIVLTGDFLYWNALQPDMPFALGEKGSTGTMDNFKVFTQDSQWGPGFRIGAGYGVTECVDLRANWTWYHNSAEFTAPGPVLATQLITVGKSGGPAVLAVGDSASSTWDLHFDMLQLECGLCLLESPVLALHPYVGVKGGWIRQSQKVVYDNFVVDGIGSPISATVNLKGDAWGVGPLFGCDGAYSLGGGFHLVANLSTALLVGQLHSEAAVDALVKSPPVLFLQSTTQTTPHTLFFPTVQCVLGLDWDVTLGPCLFCCGVGYEAQFFWNTWRARDDGYQEFVATSVGLRDLIFQGVTVHLGISF